MNLKNKIAWFIPNCIPRPTCTTGEVGITIIRRTRYWADQEVFIIHNSNYVVYYRQPSVPDFTKHIGFVSLCKGSYWIVMTDTYGDGWSPGSDVVLKAGSTTIGTYTCSSSSSSYTFTV